MTKLIITIFMITISTFYAQKVEPRLFLIKQHKSMNKTITLEEKKLRTKLAHLISVEIDENHIILNDMNKARIKRFIEGLVFLNNDKTILLKTPFGMTVLKYLSLMAICDAIEYTPPKKDILETGFTVLEAGYISLLMRKPVGKSLILRKKLKNIFEDNKEKFLNPNIELVLFCTLSYLINEEDYRNMFRLSTNMVKLNFVSYSFCARSMAMEVLSNQPKLILFNGSIWGVLPKYITTDKLRILLQYYDEKDDVPIYRYSQIMIDRKRKTFAITNLPPGIYRLKFIDPASDKSTTYNIDVNEKAVFFQHDKNKDYKQTTIDNKPKKNVNKNKVIITYPKHIPTTKKELIEEHIQIIKKEEIEEI